MLSTSVPSAKLADFRPRLAAALAATHALIDLDAYAGNVRALLTRLPQGAGLMAVVKANAYGHGLEWCALAALEAGASWLGVARIEEGLRLREIGIAAPVLVLGPPNPGLMDEAVAADIALAVGTRMAAERLATVATVASPARVHLKLDTGMHRYGAEPEEAPALARFIARAPSLRLEGLFSHFASADEPNDVMDEQIRRFDDAWEALLGAGLDPAVVHYANSAGALRGAIPARAGCTALVRCGYALYGLSPSAEVPVPAGFRPVLTLKTRLARVFTLAAGEGVSYGLTYRAARPVRCATLPLGYGDGLPRAFSNRGWVALGGVACPIRGRVCMDQTVVEVEAVPDAAEGDEAVVYGAAPGALSVDAAAGLIDTIGYELVTALSARLPRVYLRDGQPVAVSDLRGLVER